MRKPLIDWDTCIGCGSCVATCPAVFELRDDEKAWVYSPDMCDTLIDVCPTQAISWSE